MTKDSLRKLEFPILIAYLSLWLLVYILSRVLLEFSTDQCPNEVWIWLLVILTPLSAYAALRAAFSEGGKWYHSIGYFLIFTIGSVFIGQYIVLNGDILISSLIKKPSQTQAKVISVEKVFRRKLGFDHTNVKLQFNGKEITLEARPYSYFYLTNKKTLHITSGTSFLGNTYVTSTEISGQEKLSARWVHLKDWVHRHWLLWVIIACMILGTILRMKFFPETPGVKPRQIGFWKLMGIIMAVLIAIAIVLYLGLLIYVSFFVSR
ncbi:MAG: hypothetical protein EOO88_12795 [Pedobacter sp.]|nr:MAG: hypothetical protein EOO88_12795 [Pedobacter sp.]